jgi:hypothetical protein
MDRHLPRHAALCLLLATGIAQARGVRIEVALAGAGDDRRVAVTYDGVDAPVAFADAGEEAQVLVREAMWTPAGDCLALAAAAIARQRADCTRGTFRVRPALLHRNRAYEPALPFRNGGVLIHTRYLAPAASATTHWRIVPPRDGVAVVHGRLHRDPVELDGELDGYVYLGPAPAHADGPRLLVVDDGMPAWIPEAIDDALRAEQATLARLGANPGAPLAIFVHADAAEPQPTFHGDVTGTDMMRLSFLGDQGTPDATRRVDVAKFVLHELAHVHQPHGDAPPWLSEGNAEFLALVALAKSGLVGRAAALERVRNGVASCLLEVGETSWSSEPRDRGAASYDCGLALHLLDALAAGGDPLRHWGEVFAAHADWSSVHLQADRDGATADALLAGSEPFAAALGARFAALGVAVGEPDAALEQAFGMLVRGKTFAPLMAADCDGQVSFWNDPEGLRLEANDACKVLREPRTLVALAGVDLRAHPFAAATAVATQCATGPSVRAQDSTGRDLDLPCRDAYLAPRAFPRLGDVELDLWLQAK